MSLIAMVETVVANHGAMEFLHEAEAQDYRKILATNAEKVDNSQTGAATLFS